MTGGTSRFPQTPSPGLLRGRALARWDEILPPVPQDIWRANLDLIVQALSE